MERFTRLELLIGEKLATIQEKTVLIIGLGGVGGHAVEALARLGIGHLILVDPDRVALSNLNRQVIATEETLGILKTEAFQKRIHSINPSCRVDLKTMFVTASNVASLFDAPIDYVIDACDTVEAKKALLRYCTTHQIKLISSMGMGNRLDPTQIEIIDIRKTAYDPLAKIMRKMVREERLKGKIPVVWSREQPLHQTGKTIGSNALVPSVAGLLCANYIFQDIIKEDPA